MKVIVLKYSIRLCDELPIFSKFLGVACTRGSWLRRSRPATADSPISDQYEIKLIYFKIENDKKMGYQN